MRKFILTAFVALIAATIATAQTTIVYQTWTIPETKAEPALVKAFEAQNPKIHVQAEVVPFDQHFNKLYIAAQAGKTPDVVADTPEWVWDLGSRGVTRAIDDFIKKEGGKFVSQYIPMTWEFGKYKGEQHAIPWRIGASATYYNARQFKEAGIEVPVHWNWDDLVAIATKLTSAKDNRFGYAFCGSNDIVQPMWWHFANFLLQNGGRVVENNRATFNSPRGVEALQFMIDLMYKYKVVSPAITAWNYKDLFDAFASGQASMFNDGPWWLATMLTAYPDLDVGITYGPVQRTSGSPVGGTMLAMSKATKHPNEAWEFIKFMTKPESLSKWASDGKFIPPAVEVLNEDWLQAPFMRPFVVQLQAPNNQVLGLFPNYGFLRDSVQTEIQKALLRQKSPKEALDAAAQIWDEELAKGTR